jgi:glycosyltransferase involved in cell wall biosynthesis
MFHLIKGLSEYHHISLLSYIVREEDREHIPAIAKFCRKVEVILRGQSPRVYNPLCLKPRRLLVEYLNPQMAQAVARELACQAYDLCQVEYIECTPALPKIVTIPLVLTHLEVQYAGLFRAASLRTPLSPEWWGKVFRGLTMLNYEINTLRKFDAILAMCQEDAHAIRRFSPDVPMGVSPLGVDTKYFQPDERQPEPESMIYTGYYEHYPNEDAVVYFVREIFPIIRRKVPAAKFYIVGSHPSDAVRELGRLDNVVVTGRVPDLRPWLARAAVFVAPIRLGMGMRGKILEAMAMKRPVVGSSVALAGFGVTHGSEAMIADRPDAFAETVVQILTDTALRDRIAQGGYDLVQARYDWALQVRAYHHLYCLLADRARRDGPAMGQAGVREVRSAKSVFTSPLIARVNHFLLPLGLVYLTPKALWMLLTAKLRETYRAYLQRSGGRPRTRGISSLDFGLTIGSFDLGLAVPDDRSSHGVSEARRLLAEREELVARVSRQAAALKRLEEELFVARAAVVVLETRACDREQANRHFMAELESERAAAEVATIDASVPPLRSDDKPTLERGPSDSPNHAEPPPTPKESGWDSLRMRASSLEARLSDLKVRAAEFEEVLNKAAAGLRSERRLR